MGLHHNDDPTCPLCEDKLKQAHEYLRLWFIDVKKRYPTAHVCWSWRGEKDQNKAYYEGKSNLKFPNSPHNNMKNGNPCSLALDLFLLEDHAAIFPPLFYSKLNRENAESNTPIIWGGSFKSKAGKSLGDYDHFQYDEVSRKDLT